MLSAMEKCSLSMEEVVKTISKDVKNEKPDVDDARLVRIIVSELNCMGGLDALGSMSAWLMFSRKELKKNVMATLL
jgi:hypothetical protein